MAEGHSQNGTNRLLNAMPTEFRQRISANLERVSLGLRDIVYESLQPIKHVYFPLNGVISMLADMDDENLVEVATVGNEGMLGLPLFLGAFMTPGKAFSQVPGDALRMPAQAFRELTSNGGPLTNMLHRYTQALMIQISQGTGCNRVHSTEQRCARWLLMTQDRVGADEFTLTQEFLSQMVGVRRATVNEIAVRLQSEGRIDYSRGLLRIVDRKGLESASCQCYRVIRDEYERMLGS